MSFLNFVTTSGGKRVDNFSKSIPYSIESEYNPDNEYRFGFTMIKLPSGNLVDLYRLSDGHIAANYGKIVYRVSNDQGQTWGAETTLLDPAPTRVGNFAAGIAASGRIHLIVQFNNSYDFNHYYSDDNLNTLSSANTIPDADVNLKVYISTLCEIIEVSGILYAPVYGFTDYLTFTESANYVLKSIDAGANWTWTNVRGRSGLYINESSMVHLAGNNYLYISRYEAIVDFSLFYSVDGATSWTNKGSTDFAGTLDATHPPLLQKFKIKNQWVIACYYFARSAKKFYAIYATQADIITLQNWSAFKISTLTAFETYTFPGLRTGYPTVQHPYGDLRGVFTYGGEYSLNECSKVAGILPTTHYDNLVTILDL